MEIEIREATTRSRFHRPSGHQSTLILTRSLELMCVIIGTITNIMQQLITH